MGFGDLHGQDALAHAPRPEQQRDLAHAPQRAEKLFGTCLSITHGHVPIAGRPRKEHRVRAVKLGRLCSGTFTLFFIGIGGRYVVHTLQRV